MARRDSCTTQAPPNGSSFRLALPSRHRVLRQSPLPRGSGGPCGTESAGTLLAFVVARNFLPQSSCAKFPSTILENVSSNLVLGFLNDGALPSAFQRKYTLHIGLSSIREFRWSAQNVARDMLFRFLADYWHGGGTRLFGTVPPKKDLEEWRGLERPIRFSQLCKRIRSG